MGNLQTVKSSTALEHFARRFIISPHPLDLDQSILFYLHERLSDRKYVLRIISTNDIQDKQRTEDLICKKLATSKNNRNSLPSLTLIDHYIFEQNKGYCNTLSKCYLLFDIKNGECLSHYLVKNRYNNTKYQLNEDTIYRGLLNLIEGVAALKFYNHPHRHINCDTIYYDPQQNTFILGDPWISILTQSNEQYHAPEKLRQMKNQIDQHDPYLADLFSIGMVGLKLLGHQNLNQYYSVHKNLDYVELLKLTNNVKHTYLKTLLCRLLSDNAQVRQDVLNQIRLNSLSRTDLTQSNLTKTRTLSGKVASVRKSFVNQTKPIARLNQNLLRQQKYINYSQPHIYIKNPQIISVSPLLQMNPGVHKEYDFRKKQIQQSIYRPFQKIITNRTNTNQIYHNLQHNTQIIQQHPNFIKNNEFLNDKPKIDLSITHPPLNFPYTTNAQKNDINLNNPKGYNHFQVNTNLFPSSVPQNNSANHPNKYAQTLTSNIQINRPIKKENQYHCLYTENYNKNYESHQSLVHSNSNKLLKNVYSTPINYVSFDVNNQKNKLPTSLSQNGLLFKSHPLNQLNKKQITITTPSNFQKSSINFRFLDKKQVTSTGHLSENPLVLDNQISNVPQYLNQKKQKQDIAPLRTSPSYRSSQSFQSDHFYQNKIYQNLRQLQNKVSQAINSSRLNVTDSRASVFSGMIDSNHNKLIESVIVPKQPENSSHETVIALDQQLKNLDDIKDIKSDKNSSPILVKQQEKNQFQTHKNGERRSSDQSNSKSHSNSHSRTFSNQESIDYLNINSSKQSEQEREKAQQTKKNKQQEKYQDFLATPAKTPSVIHLQGNNLTIPQQSDQQSFEGEAAKAKGDFVQQVYENGGKYVGYMLNGQRNGEGVFYYKDGGFYDGKWKSNMMNGYGKLYYETGKLAYEGQWYQDEFHGRGTVHNDQPDQIPQEGFDYHNMNDSQNCWKYYEGDLSHDMKARYGKLMLSNGQYYQGEFKNDQVHGKGQFHKLDKTFIKGMWSQGIFVRQL